MKKIYTALSFPIRYARKKIGAYAFLFALICSCSIECTTIPPHAKEDSGRTHTEHTDSDTEAVPVQPLVLTFAGDLMAHTVNFNMPDYNLIYEDVKPLLHADDLSFINVETPVCDELPLSSYPSFNVHTPYLQAAAAGGFDVFSFANNHTNDHGVRGIDGTLAAIRTVQEAQDTNRICVYSGLKETAEESFRFTEFTYKDRTILFCAVTELLNSYGKSKHRLYYSPPTEQGRKELLTLIKEKRSCHPEALVILSLHLYEPEYGRTVSAEKKAWFKQLGEAGIDIIWAHHPHVMQEWELIRVSRPASLYGAVGTETAVPAAAPTAETVDDRASDSAAAPAKDRYEVLCMYSMGNFISGQRWDVRYDDPGYYREYTGDAVLLQVSWYDTAQTASGSRFAVTPILITQYNDPYPVVKQLTPLWIEQLPEKERQYFTKRLELMRQYLPIVPDQKPDTSSESQTRGIENR